MKDKKDFLLKEKETVGYYKNALKEINSNPNHDFSESEVKRIREVAKDISELNEKISFRMKEIHNNFTKGIEAIQKVFSYYGAPVFQNLKLASEIGWYISPKIIAEDKLGKLSELLTPKKLSQFENLIFKKGDKLVPIILNECSVSFPHRASIYKELGKLYKTKNYHALIALAYAQADGMCNEKWKVAFFDREKIEKVHQLKLIKKLSTTENSVSSMISNQLDICYNEITMWSESSELKDKQRRQSSFNRHLVIHGHSFNFGTKMNALRSFYLLDFINYLSLEENCP